MRNDFQGHLRSWLDQLDLPKLTKDATLALVPLLASFQMLVLLAFLPTALSGHADFRQLYTAGYMVRTGHSSELYNYESQWHFQNAVVSVEQGALPFIRPAYQALLFVPLSLLNYRAAYLMFLGINFVVLGLTVHVLRSKLAEIARCWRWLPALLFPAFLPVCVALIQGQDSVILLALLASAFVYLDDGKDLPAGLLVGLGAFKPQIVGPIALLFLVWRRWRFLSGFAMSTGAALVVSLMVIGPAKAVIFARSLFSVGAGGGFPLDVTLMANLRGLIFGLANGRWPETWIQIAIATASMLTLMVVATRPALRKASSGTAFLVAITVSVTVSYYAFVHDVCYLVIPVAILLNRLIAGDYILNRFPFFMVLTCVGMLAAPFLLFVMPSHFFLVSLPILTFLVFQVRLHSELPNGMA